MVWLLDAHRLANAEQYTASPLASMSDEELQDVARDAGMTVEQLRDHLTTPHVEMTCPLCGQPQTHLVNCKGCGGDAWGWEFEVVYGEDAADQLRAYVEEALQRHFEKTLQRQITAEQADLIGHAVQRMYRLGGCMICPDCWPETLGDGYMTCPLYLVSERGLGTGRIYSSLLMSLLELGGNEDRSRQAIEGWIKGIWVRWVDQAHGWVRVSETDEIGDGPDGTPWRVTPEKAPSVAVRGWRTALLHVVLSQIEIDARARDGS